MEALSLEVREGIAAITLNRPENANSLNIVLARELRDAAAGVAADEQVRCVTLTGRGRMFCAGGDVASFVEAPDRGSFVTELASTFHEAVLAFRSMPKPLVVLVNGPAAGAGLSLAAIGDVVLAARSAHFSAAYTRLGVTPDGGMTWLLPRLIGFRRAQDMILTNRRIEADEAERLGLVTRAVDDAMLADEGYLAARRLAEGPTTALSASRALLWEGLTTSLEDHLGKEAVSIGASANSPDGLEGVSAFLARRRPNFSSPNSSQAN